MERRTERTKKKKNKKKKWIIIGIVILILLLILSAAFGYVYTKFNKINNSDFNYSKEELSAIQNNNQGDHKVKNILLLGIDSQEKVSDTMIVLSLDETTKKVKLTSLMRDMYIYFGDDKRNKLNYAYNYGGPMLSIKTINENFKLDITDYAKVDFDGLDKVIDAVGGVDVEIKPNEVDILNFTAKDVANNIGVPVPSQVTKSGMTHLNGIQAVAYCRIRHVGNVDYERTQRQRRVLMALFEKSKHMSISQYPGLVDKLSGSVETSLGIIQILDIMKTASEYEKNGMQECRVPFDNYKSDSDLNGWYVMKWDKDKNVELLHDFIYKN